MIVGFLLMPLKANAALHSLTNMLQAQYEFPFSHFYRPPPLISHVLSSPYSNILRALRKRFPPFRLFPDRSCPTTLELIEVSRPARSPNSALALPFARNSCYTPFSPSPEIPQILLACYVTINLAPTQTRLALFYYLLFPTSASHLHLLRLYCPL